MKLLLSLVFISFALTAAAWGCGSSDASTSAGGGPAASSITADSMVSVGTMMHACEGSAPDGKCNDTIEGCDCQDCTDTALCNPDQCVTNGCCTQDDSCTCKDCWSDATCNNPGNCVDDGDCDSYHEGCQCADCKGTANCAGYDPTLPSTCGMGGGGMGGAMGSGGMGGASAGGGGAGGIADAGPG